MILQDFSPKQLFSIQDSDASINIWEGAVRSGKTYASIWRFLKELIVGPEGEYCIICRTADSFKRNIMPLLYLLLGSDPKHYKGNRELHLWGKTVHIIGADDERAEAKVRGPTFMGAYVDEISIIPESVFKMLVSRCAMGGAKIFGTTNPDSPFHWLKKDYLTDNPDVKSWQFKLDDNPQLLTSEKEYLKRQYTGLWYRRFIEGQWVLAEGVIYDFFDEKIHCMEIAPTSCRYYVCGIDYGTTNPCAFSLIGYNPENYPNLWVEDEYYWDSKEHNRQKTDSEYAIDLKRFLDGYNVKAIVVDPSAASFKAELIKMGFQNIMDANNDVLDGIRFTSKLLSNGTLKVCKKCKNLVKEIQTYVWDERSIKLGEDRPLKQNDHVADSVRYTLNTWFLSIYNGTGEMDVEEYRRWKSDYGWR